MPIRMSEVTPAKAKETLQVLISCLRSDEDIRKCLSNMSSVAFAFGALVDLHEDPDVRFVSYLLVSQFGNVQAAYDGHTDRWYRLNISNVSEMRKELEIYCNQILEAIESDKPEKIIDATKLFYSKFHSLARLRTMDVRRR